MKFESLGAPVWGCEFGFVQQKFGAEPISLLRWASINTLRLIEALEHRFEGTGDSGQTTLHRPVNMQRDYHTRDTRFWIETHTFMFLGDVSEEKLLQQYCCNQSGWRTPSSGNVFSAGICFARIICPCISPAQPGLTAFQWKEFSDDRV